ncbi:MAG: prenyltransferase/squalene oxidase repeat-containing protein [Candidatus Brocadiia bacterium]
MSRARIWVAVIGLFCFAGAACAQEMDLRVTDDIEKAVSRGLEFLARTQNADGSWPPPNGQGCGVVGLHLLAFLAHGETPDEGRYGLVMRRAVEYIVSHQEANGLLCGPNGSPMYNHGFATLALAEVYGMIDYPKLGPALKKAVGLIVTSQNRQGGWRYNVGEEDSDTTVSGAQMVALRAAASGGIEVPLETMQRGVQYYKSMYCPGGGFGYQAPNGPNDARSGIGLLVMCLSGAYHSEEAKVTADWLANNPWGLTYFSYRNYYCAQAMLQAGGRYWKKWNDVQTPVILNAQQPDESWIDQTIGPTLPTAFNLLALEVNYYYLPIYQR